MSDGDVFTSQHLVGEERVAGIICNPVDLSYRYQDIRPGDEARSVAPDLNRRTVNREAADPSVVYFRGHYFMFASMSHGVWHSEDLVTWQHHHTDKLPALDYAPDVREVGGALLISASRRDEVCPFFLSRDPLSDDFVEVSPGALAFWDPHLFEDADGSLYLYWGCDNKTPLQAVQLDPDTLEPLSVPLDLFGADLTHGWERPGEDNRLQEPANGFERIAAEIYGTDPFIEGAWMTRRGDTYYLQYAAPGTEVNVYADGYYTGSSPLGPFTYAPSSPFSSKPGGFITGAGHGSTFQDAYGNWWHAATMRISVNHTFERRVGLFPAGFDEDGNLFCNQNFGDYPMRVPARRFDPWTESSTGWMLLSFRAGTSASSSLPGHGHELVVDEDVRSWWVAGDAEPGHWVQVDLGRTKTIHAVQVNLADHELADRAPDCTDLGSVAHEDRGIFAEPQPTEVLLEVSADGVEWVTVSDSRGQGTDAPHALHVLDAPRRARHVRVTAGRSPFGGHFAVSGLRVFGLGDDERPREVLVRAERTDPVTASLGWDRVPGATGYNVRYGLAPERLYQSWLVYDREELELRGLNAGHDYWVAVDAFNDAGVTPGTAVPVRPRPASLVQSPAG